MPITQWCWRCKQEIPMLDESEWAQMVPFLRVDEEEFRRTGIAGAPALEKDEQLPGFKSTVFNAVWHHRASLYGPPCSKCGKPLRTRVARFCAECGADAA